jgi:hypothetical protein
MVVMVRMRQVRSHRSTTSYIIIIQLCVEVVRTTSAEKLIKATVLLHIFWIYYYYYVYVKFVRYDTSDIRIVAMFVVADVQMTFRV